MRIWRHATGAKSPGINHGSLVDSYKYQAIHLFRGLLRQCTYLPDPAARKHMHHHIISRFRDYCPHPSQLERRKPPLVIAQRRPKMLKTARIALRYLQRANGGHLQHLEKILAMSYGRIGTRRYELLKRYKIPDVPVDSKALEEFLQPSNQDVPHPSQQLMALIKAHSVRKFELHSRPPIKHTRPQIPETNTWGRPMPMRRVRNIKRRWYADSLSKIMPPLPQNDWEHLRKLATGEAAWHGSIPRRGPSEEDGVGLAQFRSPTGAMSRPHEITPRYMRRLWTRIFTQCPLMKENTSKSSGWEVIWGESQKKEEVTLGLKANWRNTMFEGVDENGRKIVVPR